MPCEKCHDHANFPYFRVLMTSYLHTYVLHTNREGEVVDERKLVTRRRFVETDGTLIASRACGQVLEN